jgi:hypothetical protein
MRKVSAKAAKKYEAKQVARIGKWRTRRPGRLARLIAYATSPVSWAIHKAIPTSAVEATLHGNATVASRWARERITLRHLGVSSVAELTEAELLHSDRVVRKIHRRAVYLAAGVGIASGMFGIFGLPVGMAAALNVAMRTIHRIGLCYGYPASTEAERLFVFYTLSLAGNRPPHEKDISLNALRRLHEAMAKVPDPVAGAPLDDEIRQHALSVAHHDFSNEITRQLIEVRLLTSIPGIGAIMGLIVDTNYMRSVGWAARHAYQLRWLRDRGRSPEWEAALAVP